MSPQTLQLVCSDSYLSAWGCLPFHHHPHILPQVNWGRRMDDGALCNLIRIKASADLLAGETKDVASNNSWCWHVWHADMCRPMKKSRVLAAFRTKDSQLHKPPWPEQLWSVGQINPQSHVCWKPSVCIQNLITSHHLTWPKIPTLCLNWITAGAFSLVSLTLLYSSCYSPFSIQ